MQVIIEESEYKNLCDIKDKYLSSIKTQYIYFPRNNYFCYGYAYSNYKAFDELIDINNKLSEEITKLQKELDYYKCRSFWQKFKNLWKN